MVGFGSLVNREGSYMFNHFTVEERTLEIVVVSSSGISYSLGQDLTVVEAMSKITEIAHSIVLDRAKIMDSIMSCCAL